MSKLSELGSILNGKTIPINHGKYPAYGGNGIIDYVDSYNYSENTIIIGRVGANCGAIHFCSSKCWVTDNALAFVVKNNDPYFVYCLLKLLNLNKFHIGSSQPLITQGIINEIETEYLKDIKVQENISKLFRIIDKKVENNKNIISELESMAKTIYDYWFLQYEFPNENGKPYKSSGGKLVWNEELKREIPEGWEIKRIGEILSKIPNTYKYNSAEYKENGKFPIIDQSSNYICGYTDKEEDLLELNDCVVFGDHTKFVKYVNFNFARGADGTQILNSKDNRLSNFLLYMQISNMQLVSQGYSRYFKFLKDKYVVLPKKQITELYMKKVDIALKKIRSCRKENKELTKLRDFLLPLLMNGQVGFKE